MSGEDRSKLERSVHELTGAVDVLTSLREDFEAWVGEAQDASKREALENVLGHVEEMETEFKRRRDEARKRLAASR